MEMDLSHKKQKMDLTETFETELIKLIVKWSSKEYEIEIDSQDVVAVLKYEIFKQTNVKPERQKILNLKYKGKMTTDDTLKIADLDIKPNFKLMMVGSLEEDIANINTKPEDLPEVLNDFDEIDEGETPCEFKQVYIAKVNRRIKEYNIDLINPPRQDKKLLVLDIDYTLFDHRSSAETPGELMRPYLHEFLAAAYEYYDIVIWSATSMKWIIEKMRLLGVQSNENYKIIFYLDSNAMITIHCPKRGVVEVKPLAVIWGKYSQYSSKNTIMFDDIRRNFLMNPRSGLRIKPFCQAHLNRSKDTELLKLSTYLKNIAENCDDFNKLNHRKWESYNPRQK